MRELRITTPDRGEASLLVLLLEELLGSYLSNPVIARLLGATGAVIAVRGGTSTATVRIEGGEVRLENGMAPDAWLRVDGDVDALLAVATLDAPILPLVTGRVRVRARPAALSAIPRLIARRRGGAR